MSVYVSASRFPRLTAALGEEGRQELQRLLEEIQKDTLKQAATEARSAAKREVRRG